MFFLTRKFLFSKSVHRSITFLITHEKASIPKGNKRKNVQFLSDKSVAISAPTFHRTFATMSDNCAIKTANYEDVLNYGRNDSILIVDVREPNELTETGQIPGSINVPLGDVQNVFKNVPDVEFKAKYGRQKPSLDTPLVFHCRSGKRSAMALDIIQKLGYTDLTNYTGGWLDWEEHLKNQ